MSWTVMPLLAEVANVSSEACGSINTLDIRICSYHKPFYACDFALASIFYLLGEPES